MKRHLPDILLLTSLTLAFLVYFPGTSGFFTFDDTLNILDNTHIRIQALNFPTLSQAALSGDAGMLGRPLSVLSFALNYYFTSLNPYHFKLTNIVIHLCNGLCVYILTILILETCRQRELTGCSQAYSRWISLAVASAWLLHPLNLTGVLYIVQRMTSLAALFTLMGLISYVYGRQKIASGKAGWGWVLASFALFTPLAMFSKENGALLPVFMLVIEVIFFRFQTPSTGVRRTLIALFGICVFLPFVALMLYFIVNPAWLTGGYSTRDFTLTERLLTEARVMWFYMQNVFAPNLSQLGMYHDDIPVSKSLFEPVSTFFACIGIVLLAVLACLFRKRQPIAAFCILFFLVGHSMESSVFSLELVHEHRNYLPDYGLLLILFYTLLYPLRHLQSLKARQLLAAFFIFVLAGLTFIRATQWGNPSLMRQMAAANHPNSIRANAELGAWFAAMPGSSKAQADEYYRHAYEHYTKAASLSPADTSGLFGLIVLNAKHQLPIEKSWVSALAGRIESQPFSTNTANALANLEKCMVIAECPLSPEIMEALMQAALRNPTLQGSSKALVLFAWSDFLFKVKKQPDVSATQAYGAVAANPKDLDNQMTLIIMLINLGKASEAQARITQTRQLDKMGLYTKTLDELEKHLAAR